MENNQLINAAELRIIILGLKMAEFSFIDDEKTCDKVKFMIEELPSAEKLNECLEKPGELEKIREKVGCVMSIIENAGRKDETFKAHYEAKKQIPPRYQVLKWRSAMNKDLVKGLIRISSVADEKERFEIADKSIVLAKKMVDNKINSKDILNLISECKTAGLEKEANWFTDMWNQWTGHPGRGIQRDIEKQKKQDQKQQQKITQTTLDSLAYLSEIAQNEQYDTGEIAQLINSVEDPNVQTKLQQYSEHIANLEQEFSQWVQGLSNEAQQMIQTYRETGGQAFFKGEQEIQEESEGAIEDVTSLEGEVPSEMSATEQSNENIGKTVTHGNSVGTILEMYDDGGALVKWESNPDGPIYVSPNQLKRLQIASSKKSIRLSNRKKWIRIV